MNLSETDKELIADIVEEKLRHYKLINEPAVDVVEPEYAEEVYVKANKTIGEYITKDKWYLVVEEMFEHYRITQDNGNVASTHKLHFDKPVSKAQYLAQQKELSQPKQEESTKWNVIVEQFEHNKKDHKIVIAYTDHHILTEELAQSAATKIRNILKEL